MCLHVIKTCQVVDKSENSESTEELVSAELQEDGVQVCDIPLMACT